MQSLPVLTEKELLEVYETLKSDQRKVFRAIIKTATMLYSQLETLWQEARPFYRQNDNGPDESICPACYNDVTCGPCQPDCEREKARILLTNPSLSWVKDRPTSEEEAIAYQPRFPEE